MTLSRTARIRVILAALVLTLVFSPKQVEKLGDNFQIVLPVLGLGCSVINGRALEFTVRYLAQEGGVLGSKFILGDAAINQRPNGGSRGMPSGHTATAVFGATYLADRCVGDSPAIKAVVIATAVFVGGSRLYSQAHNIWQVLMGALIGWLGARAFRSRPPLKWPGKNRR